MTVRSAKERARRFFMVMASSIGLGQLIRCMEDGSGRVLEDGSARVLESE